MCDEIRVGRIESAIQDRICGNCGGYLNGKQIMEITDLGLIDWVMVCSRCGTPVLIFLFASDRISAQSDRSPSEVYNLGRRLAQKHGIWREI